MLISLSQTIFNQVYAAYKNVYHLKFITVSIFILQHMFLIASLRTGKNELSRVRLVSVEMHNPLYQCKQQ